MGEINEKRNEEMNEETKTADAPQEETAAKERGVLLVLSGPSGTGKGTVCKLLREHMADGVRYSISATTRQPREGEEDGREYFFFDRPRFEALRAQDGFLEWAEVYGNYYGTPRAYVEEVLSSGRDCILEIDTQGAFKVRDAAPEAVLAFLAPPSMEELRCRLTGRGTESAAEVEKRLGCAESEMACRHRYDYIVVNDTVERAAAALEAILKAERCRTSRVLAKTPQA